MAQSPSPNPNNGGGSPSVPPSATPAPPSAPAQLQFFVARSGNNDGPYSLQQLNAQVASGAVKANDLVWYEGAAGWTPVSQISGIQIPYSPPAPSLPGVAPQQQPQQPQQQPRQGSPAPDQDETTIFEISPSILPDIVLCVLTCGFWLLVLPWRYLSLLSCKYHLTTERLIITAGIVGKKSEDLEIYRVRDITVEQPLIGRMLGLGTVIIAANDASSPRIELIAISDAQKVKEQIRQASRASRKAEGVRSVEYLPSS